MNIHVYLNVPGSILVMVIIWIDMYLIAYNSSSTEDRMILRKIIWKPVQELSVMNRD